MKRAIVLLVAIVGAVTLGSAQVQHNLYQLNPDSMPEGVQVKPLHSDSLVSSFMIWVSEEVKPHFHQGHSEHVVIIDGMAEILLGDETKVVGPGDLIFIPQGTRHAVKVLSKQPLKVLSIQAPHFSGESDRTPLPVDEDVFRF